MSDSTGTPLEKGMIEGLGEGRLEYLKEEGITTLEGLAQADAADLDGMPGGGEAVASAVIEAALELVEAQAQAAAKDKKEKKPGPKPQWRDTPRKGLDVKKAPYVNMGGTIAFQNPKKVEGKRVYITIEKGDCLTQAEYNQVPPRLRKFVKDRRKDDD